MTDATACHGGAPESKPTVLKALLHERHWQTYRRFRKEYVRAANAIDGELADTCPSDSTFRRWLSGRIGGIPRSEPCAVLEAMFPGYTAKQLLQAYRDEETDAGSVHDNLIPAWILSADGQQIAAWHDQCITVPTTNAEAQSTARPGAARDVEDVKRKEFVAGLVATMAAPALVLSSSEPARIGAADVARYRQNLLHLYALDDHHGASGEVYGLTVRSLRHLVRTLESYSYSPAVGDQLRSITGQMMEHAGWLAFDASQHHDARYWWLEALYAARMGNDTDTEVVVLSSMSLAASQHGRGREAVDLARTATQIVRRERPSARLRSLLAAREALGHAHIGDRAATQQALDRAHVELHQSAHDNDPLWLDFWGEPDLASHACRAYRRLDDLATAERSARSAVGTVDAARYPRNQALYQIDLGSVLIAQRNLDEGLPVVANAALQTTGVDSDRLTTEVRAVVRDLRARHGNAPAVRELAEWTSTSLSSPSTWPTAF